MKGDNNIFSKGRRAYSLSNIGAIKMSNQMTLFRWIGWFLCIAIITACSNNKKDELPGLFSGDPDDPLSTEFDMDGDGIYNVYDYRWDDPDIWLQGNGSAGDPFIITNVYQLQAIAGVDHAGQILTESVLTNRTWLFGDSLEDQLGKSYLIQSNIDAADTLFWRNINDPQSLAGFSPIGNCGADNICNTADDTPFRGQIIGRSNITINGLYIGMPLSEGVGLFGMLSGSVDKVILTNLRVEGGDKVGGVAGVNKGSINRAIVSGQVQGLIRVGGAVGVNQNVMVNSYASSQVEGYSRVGGLVGENQGRLSNSSAETRLDAFSEGGGLVGVNDIRANVTRTYSIGNVSGAISIGGLIGNNLGRIISSYALGVVTGSTSVGGLTGDNHGEIRSSYSINEVSGDENIGGLVGINHSILNRTYAQGDVTGTDKVGGLVGFLNHREGVYSSYASGRVRARRFSGGLVGYSIPTARVSLSYWDRETSQRSSSFGVPTSAGISSRQLRSCGLNGIRYDINVECDGLFNASFWGGRIDNGDGTYSLWYFNDEKQYPLLVTESDQDQNTKATCISGVEANNPFCVARLYVLDATMDLRIGKVAASRIFSLAPQYEIIAPAGSETAGLVRIDSAGIIYMRRAATASDIGVYNFAISATDPSRSGDGELITFRLELTNIPPKFGHDHYTFSGLPALFPELDISAFDSEKRGLVYTISPPYNNTFDITSGGRISPRGIVAIGTYDFMVRARDEVGAEDQVRLTLEIAYGDRDGDSVIDYYDSFPDDDARYIEGTGAGDDPFIIRNVYQLQAVAEIDHIGNKVGGGNNFFGGKPLYTNKDILDLYYVLGNNIDANVTRTWNLDRNGIAQGFVPIGGCASVIPCNGTGKGFGGSFNGNGFKIHNLYINSPRGQSIGLFGAIENKAKVANLGLENADILGLAEVGGLAGTNKGEITLCYTSGRVQAVSRGAMLVGENEGSVVASYSTGLVEGLDSLGGLVAYQTGGEIISSYSVVNITARNILGGLIGEASGGEVASSYAVGNLSGFQNALLDTAGAFIGSADGITINSSYWDEDINPQLGGIGINLGVSTMPQGLTSLRFQGCSLDGGTQDHYSGNDCGGLFPSASWGSFDVTGDKKQGQEQARTVTWVFNNTYPLLDSSFVEGERKYLPSLEHQACQIRYIMEGGYEC